LRASQHIPVPQRLHSRSKDVPFAMSDSEKKTFTDDEALAFHQFPTPGKIAIAATKPMATQRDLSLAYSPGVAVPVLAIAENPGRLRLYLQGQPRRGDLQRHRDPGLGNLGALASKPVMEGKAVLFKRFADVDSIDIELATEDPDEIITVVKNIGRPSAASIWRTSRAPNASSSSSPARAARHPGLPRRPARHRDHRRRRPDQRLLHHRPKLEDVKVVVNGAGAAGWPASR
jgi:malate dehydrogenase (oxaloacetate-decarboxylating)(NADP+)